jgi:hypothetical protein
MKSGATKLLAAFLLVVAAMSLDLTSAYSPVALAQLIVSLILAIAGALVAVRGVIDYLSEKF